MPHLSLARVGGHGKGRSFGLRLSGTLHIRLALSGSLDHRTRPGFGTDLGGLRLGELDVPRRFLDLGHRSLGG